MSHKRKPGDPPVYHMDQTQIKKKQKYDEIKAVKDAIDHEYAAEQTHLNGVYAEKKLLGIVRGLLKELDDVEGGTIMRLVHGNYIYPLKKAAAADSMKKEQNEFLDRIHTLETQMKRSVQKQRELRKRQDVLMVELSNLDIDGNYRYR